MKVRTATQKEIAARGYRSEAPIVCDELVTIDGYDVDYIVCDENDDGTVDVTVCWSEGYEIRSLFLQVADKTTGNLVLTTLSDCLSTQALRAFGFALGL